MYLRGERPPGPLGEVRRSQCHVLGDVKSLGTQRTPGFREESLL